MANYSTLKSAIQAVIKQNGNNEITGSLLQSSLVSMIDSLGAGYQFMGVATPATNPGTPDQKVFYIGGAGEYNNFGTSITVVAGSIGVFRYDSAWSNTQININGPFSYNIFNLTLYLNSRGQTDYVASFTDAVALIPTNVRQRGLIFTFATDSSYREWEIWQYNYDALSDSSFYNILLWKRLLDDYGTGVLNLSLFKYKKGSSGYWSDINAALAYLVSNVPTSCRYRGMYLTFATNDSYNDWQLWQYMASSNGDSSVGNINNWVRRDYLVKDNAPTPDSTNVVTSGGIANYCKKSFISNNGTFNALFKEFFIKNLDIDITTVTSMYIDKAYYRSSDGLFRTQIVLKVGNNEVYAFVFDGSTETGALNAVINNGITKLVDTSNSHVLYCVLNWDSLASNQRHTFNVSLLPAVGNEQSNPAIFAYRNYLKRSKYLQFEQLAWFAGQWGGGTSFVDSDWRRYTTEKITINSDIKSVYLSTPNSNYKFEMYVFDSNNNKVAAYDSWNAGNNEMVFPSNAAYFFITAAKTDDSRFYENQLLTDNATATLEFRDSLTKGYALHTLTIGNQNVRTFQDDGDSGDTGGSIDPSTYEPLWKEQFSHFLNADFLTIVEWRNYFDQANTIDTYNVLLKQFYPYHYEIDGVRGLFSKIPCTFEVKTRNYTQLVAKTMIHGKTLAVVAWVQGNLDDAAKVRADSQWMIDYLSAYDLIVVSGDFNNEQSVDLLQVWIDNGFTLGNCGYWGEISTCTDSAFTHSSNDNVVAKGFIYKLFEKGQNRLGSDHYPVRAVLQFNDEI